MTLVAMSSLQLRQNLTVPDLQSYYTSLWSGDQASFSSSQESGWLTDLKMVGWVLGKKEIGCGSVKVHKAVILPFCPHLSKLLNGVDDSKVIFADVRVEVIKSVVKLLYTGECTLSPIADVTAIMDLVRTLGIDITPARLQVNRSEDGMNNHAPRVEESCRSKNVRAGNLLPDETEFVFSSARGHTVGTVDTEDSLENIDCNTVTRVPRSSETEPKFCCELCKYECMFWTQLLEHSKEFHGKRKVEYKVCDTKSPTLKHYHAGDLLNPFVRIIGNGRRCRMCVASLHKNQNRRKAKENLTKTTGQCQICCASVCRRHAVKTCKNCAGSGTWDVGHDGEEDEGTEYGHQVG